MNAVPQIKADEELYVLLRAGKIEEFNTRVAGGETCDLTNCDFRGLDLRLLQADGLDLSGGYFRSCDIRGVNLGGTTLECTSFHDARIAGVFFPANFRADEIMMSVKFGTRMRSTS